MPANSLPEIREGDAPPEVAHIYEDIRRCMRLPLVNLIYRHFATLPDVLPRVWGLVRAMMLSGELDAALGRMNRELPIPQLASFEPSMLADLGKDNQVAIRRVIETYNRGNGLNLIALTAIDLGVRQRRLRALEFMFSEAQPDHKGLPFPWLLKFAELAPKTADQVANIARLHGSGSGVVPSLYLHLANWPEFLIAVGSRIGPLLKDGSIEHARRTAVEFAYIEAEGLVLTLPSGPVIAELPEQAISTLERFIRQVIPEMLLIGLALENALSRQDSNS